MREKKERAMREREREIREFNPPTPPAERPRGHSMQQNVKNRLLRLRDCSISVKIKCPHSEQCFESSMQMLC